MKIAVGADHRGFLFKKRLIPVLRQEGHEVADLGTHRAGVPCDYPVIAAKVARRVASGAFERGILICGTGVGMSIAANKIRGIRAARCVTPRDAAFSRKHNDANVLTLGSMTSSFKTARAIAAVWLKTEAESGRHRRRVKQILTLEKGLKEE
ncbi:MAG: ribose 5-phosphate isomerase B [Candidatus Omnitrophota bacterium]